MVYKWGDGFRVPGDAQKVGEHLEKLRLRHGFLTARIVLDDATPSRSPIHGYFEWDDREAAVQYRLQQAQYLLRAIVVVHEESKVSTRAFVVVRDEGEQHYTSIATAMSNEEMRRQVLSRALAELDSWRHRYEELEELAAVFQAAEQVRAAQLVPA
jgi:hypothetical protein